MAGGGGHMGTKRTPTMRPLWDNYEITMRLADPGKSRNPTTSVCDPLVSLWGQYGLCCAWLWWALGHETVTYYETTMRQLWDNYETGRPRKITNSKSFRLRSFGFPFGCDPLFPFSEPRLIIIRIGNHWPPYKITTKMIGPPGNDN